MHLAILVFEPQVCVPILHCQCMAKTSSLAQIMEAQNYVFFYLVTLSHFYQVVLDFPLRNCTNLVLSCLVPVVPAKVESWGNRRGRCFDLKLARRNTWKLIETAKIETMLMHIGATSISNWSDRTLGNLSKLLNLEPYLYSLVAQVFRG